MKKEDLIELSNEALINKAKGLKILIWAFIPVIAGLVFFTISDYMSTNEFDMPMLTITICTFGGIAVVYPELKMVNDELKKRE